MSRLIDRILAGCQPLRMDLMFRLGELEESIRAEIQQVVARDSFDFRDIENIPVIVGDDVAAYVASLPQGTNMEDVVGSMAPPFSKFFVEFHNVPTAEFLHAWGALVQVLDKPDDTLQIEGENDKPRWILELTSFIEREKGKPFGPVAIHHAGLAEDGTWFRHPETGLFWGGGPVVLNEGIPAEVSQEIRDNVAQNMFPVLLTISFMHCKNVKIRPITPPEKLSRKHEKKHGHGLVRYHVLEIEPIRRILDKYRKGIRDDLRRALHICRGHFKTFTPDAPLMGRHTGTYWWEPHVKGSKEAGTVLKDYRVRASRELGKGYREADENPPDREREAPPSKDPDSLGRGLAAHNRTQNTIAGILRRFGIEPLSPAHDEPEFDIAWKTNEMFYVCEVKSITTANEERQLRMAIGQVIRYRQKLAARGHEPISTVIATERPPSDTSWQDLCEHEGILLLWPDVAENRLKPTVVAQA